MPCWYLKLIHRIQCTSGDFTVPKDLGKESTPDGFASMDGNHRATPIWVTKEVVASFDANQLKAKKAKCLDELLSCWR